MEAYQNRVVDELNELKVKLIALRSFNDDSSRSTMSIRNKKLMLEQERHMTNYAHVLSDRIDSFEQ